MLNKYNNIIFWGTPDFSLPSLQSIQEMGLLKAVVTQPDKKAGRGKKIIKSPVKQYALKNNIAILEPQKLDEDFIDKLKKYLPATFLVVAYGKIIPKKVLNLSEMPALNIHPSLLPELRGPSPIQTALLRGFKSTGVSLIQLDEKMDHGPILGQIEANIDTEDDYISLSKKLAEVSAQLLSEELPKYLNGQIIRVAQDEEKTTYCKLIEKKDGHIDWNHPAFQIYNQIRAFTPWPSAYTSLGNLDIKIIKAKIVDKEIEPGHIEEDLIIGTGEKSLKILELQPSGKKIMTAQEFIRGYKKYLDKNFK